MLEHNSQVKGLGVWTQEQKEDRAKVSKSRKTNPGEKKADRHQTGGQTRTQPVRAQKPEGAA